MNINVVGEAIIIKESSLQLFYFFNNELYYLKQDIRDMDEF